jgi:hypothetical protein
MPSDSPIPTEGFNMTKDLLDKRLALLPLLVPVETEYGTNPALDDMPVIILTFQNIPGPGMSELQIPISPSEQNMKDLANNLPLLDANRLASLAILLAPPLAQ